MKQLAEKGKVWQGEKNAQEECEREQEMGPLGSEIKENISPHHISNNKRRQHHPKSPFFILLQHSYLLSCLLPIPPPSSRITHAFSSFFLYNFTTQPTLPHSTLPPYITNLNHKSLLSFNQNPYTLYNIWLSYCFLSSLLMGYWLPDKGPLCLILIFIYI